MNLYWNSSGEKSWHINQRIPPPLFTKRTFFQLFCFFFWRLVARIAVLFNSHCFFVFSNTSSHVTVEVQPANPQVWVLFPFYFFLFNHYLCYLFTNFFWQDDATLGLTKIKPKKHFLPFFDCYVTYMYIKFL